MSRNVKRRLMLFLMALVWLPNAPAGDVQERAFVMPATKQFIRTWKAAASSELGNAQSFFIAVCRELGMQIPDAHRPDDEENGYIFEKSVPMLKDGRITKGRADVYRARCFVWENKQYQPDMPPETRKKPSVKTGLAVRESAAWYAKIMDAKLQAEVYSRSLAAADGHIPFLVVCDAGYTIHLFADFQGRGVYSAFPSAKNNKIYLEDFEKPEIREMLRALWLDPMSLDPTRKTERVTKEIAHTLSELTASLEQSGHDPDTVAMFTMRAIFSLFAEDVTLLPHASFQDLLERHRNDPEALAMQLSLLWQTMRNGGYLPIIDAELPQIGGNFFNDVTVLPLTPDQIDILIAAARANWADVAPSIFGTLLERALKPADRHRMGAHYTPPIYVERLVIPTIIQPLRHQWNRTAAMALEFVENNDYDTAIKVIEDFHGQLCDVTVLDPSCGSGNILAIAYGLLKDLEDEVLQALHDLGKYSYIYRSGLRTVSPNQFKGIEINPHAVAITELVLSIAQLQRHYATYNSVKPQEPILYNGRTIEQRDAILAHDGMVDGVYINPRPAAEWPAARYVVGNPPFIGTGKKKREALGDAYVNATHAAYPELKKNVNIVMLWWHRAAQMVRFGSTERFGFITSNTVKQVQNRSVMKMHLEGEPPLSIVFAIPDHPWKNAEYEASVRIAMTVGAKGDLPGVLSKVDEEKDDGGTYFVSFTNSEGIINSNLSLGADTTAAKSLLANAGVARTGVILTGTKFVITPTEAATLGLGRVPGLEQHIKPYRNGRDVVGIPRNKLVIDLYGLDIADVESRFPEVYAYLRDNVKPQRDKNRTESAKKYWWLFTDNTPELRKAIAPLERYIATVKTAKHRVFVFLDKSILPESGLVAFPFDDAFYLGILSSRIHETWSLTNSGLLEDRPRYMKTVCFDNFPFPDATEEQRDQIRTIAEELDAHRKKALADNPRLTLTGIYNILAKHNAGQNLTNAEKRTFDTADLARLVELHNSLDNAVFAAYGWPSDLTPAQIKTRVTNLNHLRAQDERDGKIQWLRPEQQQQEGEHGELEEAGRDIDGAGACRNRPFENRAVAAHFGRIERQRSRTPRVPA